MALKVHVKGDFNDAMKKFSNITNDTRKTMKRHEYYLRPGLRQKEKSKEATKIFVRQKKKRKLMRTSSAK